MKLATSVQALKQVLMSSSRSSSQSPYTSDPLAPVKHSSSPPSTIKLLEGLLTACAPATFGRNGKDVYDEDYRKAIKLDTTEFATDFSPYETGIIDIIAQLLLPSVNTDKFGIRAELYKLNAYRAPSGHFRPHVDTPRGEDQIGSLVVCLPTIFKGKFDLLLPSWVKADKHKGGELGVRHKGNDIRFNWSSTSDSAPKIQWAAFYSDCEHEVFPVTSGSRITLTYNLFASRGFEKLAGSQTINANPTSLPLYTTLQDALASPNFMRKGGQLGIYLAHAYPFTHSTLHRSVRPALKGGYGTVCEPEGCGAGFQAGQRCQGRRVRTLQ